MTDREKVIKGLECCINRSELRCINECPYYTDELHFAHECWLPLNRDALALLKAQEPRVMTLEEVKDIEHDTVVWYEHIGAYPPRPRVVHYANDEHIMFSYGGDFRYCADEYGKHFRLWTSHPTDAQREATPWSN